VEVEYFQEQGMEVFLDMLRAQGWPELFAHTHLGCSVPTLAEFYANCNVTNIVVTSEVNRKKLKFNAKDPGVILGVPAEGFDVYVRDSTAAKINSNTEPVNKVESPPVRQER